MCGKHCAPSLLCVWWSSDLLTLPQRAAIALRLGVADGAHGLEPPPGLQQGGGQVVGQGARAEHALYGRCGRQEGVSWPWHTMMA